MNDTIVINDTKIEPKILPFRCPVCKGWGKVNYGKEHCNTCNGKGVILVNQEKQQLINNNDSRSG